MSNSEYLSPEILVPRMGEYLVEKGLVTAEELARALKHQEALRQKNEDRLLGQVLVDLGFIDHETRDSAITELILQLKAALQEANQQLLEANQQLEQRVQERTAELEKALAKLAELNQLKANIVANISHELRTPLTHLKGYLELLVAGDLGPVNEQQNSALAIIERSTDRLGRLIEDLLLFSSSQNDQMQISMGSFDLQVLSLSALHKTKHKAKERNIKLVYECDEKIPNVEGDEDKISWVIIQLLDNAIKFTQPGGMVTLRIHPQEGEVNVMILDTGIGIPAARIDEVFDSFYQLDGSTTRRAGGTGLGLALAKNIIEAHGSNIQVTSEVGKGSCFSFSLKKHPGGPADR